MQCDFFLTSGRRTVSSLEFVKEKCEASLSSSGIICESSLLCTFKWRYIIAPSIFHRGYSYLVLKLFKLRVPSLNLEHSSGRGNLTLKCGLMFKE